jgi:putative flippase GtrA
MDENMASSTHRQFFNFLIIGGTGTLLNLSITWLVVTFVLGLENYFFGTMIGLSANILYNFTFYTRAVFKTQKNHVRRLIIFSIYSTIIALLYATFVKVATPVVGAPYYILVSIGAILFFAVVNYLVLKTSIFKE